jgi:hypothetical protein
VDAHSSAKAALIISPDIASEFPTPASSLPALLFCFPQNIHLFPGIPRAFHTPASSLPALLHCFPQNIHQAHGFPKDMTCKSGTPGHHHFSTHSLLLSSSSYRAYVAKFRLLFYRCVMFLV